MSKEDKKDKKRPRGSSSTDGEEDKILEKLFSIQTRIDDGFTKMEDAMTDLKQEIKQDILAIKNELDELKKIDRKCVGWDQHSQGRERINQETNGEHAQREC